MSPYRAPAEDVEAGLDASEVAAFKAALARSGRGVRLRVLLTVLLAVAPAIVLATLSLSLRRAPATPPSPQPSRCETHLVWPAAGDPFPMTVCR